MYNAIPEALRSISQWVCWQLKEIEGSKPTKIPLDPKTGRLASVSNSATWGTFEEAVWSSRHCDGIGFVLTDNDPYSVIDLDATDNPEVQQRQLKIAEYFNSYAEISPSGKGLHVWVKGNVPSGRKREAVEVYSSGRYMTVTGRIYRNKPIENFHEPLNQLWAEMEVKPSNDNAHYLNSPETCSDYEILKYASEAVNGQKFIDLYEGRWQEYFPAEAYKTEGCNEADQALVNCIAFYTQNREQIKRIFRASALGKRAKAKREDYFEHPRWGMLNKSFDRMPQPIDMEGLRSQLEQQLAVKTAEAKHATAQSVIERQLKQEEPVKAELPQNDQSKISSSLILENDAHSKINISKDSNNNIFKYSVPPGLVGEIARFIHDAAPRPVPEIAIAGAIGLMSGVCGRSYNVSGTGLNQYILILAMTGAGKESCASGIDKLMAEALKTVPAASEFIGPGEIASPQALMKYMNKTSKCFMSLVGEFGMKFRQLCSERASTNDIGLKRIFLDLYNKSGKDSILKPLIYSDKDKNTEPIKSPAFSMLGETTPETFYENLNANLISDGLLPRFTIIEYKGKRPQLNENHLKVSPSQQLSEQFSALCAYSLQLNNGNNCLQVQIDKDSLKLFKEFDKHCDYQINHASNDVTRQLWNRAHIKSLKLAALLAVGCNYINPVINVECATWALQLITQDVQNLLTRFESGEIGVNNVQNDQATDIKKVIKKYVTGTCEDAQKYPGCSVTLWQLKVIPHSYISAACRQRASFKNDRLGPVNAVKICIQSLIDCGEIVELSPQDKRTKNITERAKLYMISGMKV